MTPAGPDRPPADTPAPATASRERKGTLFLVGVDGLTLDVIEPMVARGELPSFSLLAQKGCHGPLRTISPTNSSLLWTTIATGCHHRVHGIDGFEFYTLLGRRISRSAVRKAKKFGLRRLIKALRSAGWMKSHFLDGRHVRAKPLWDIFSEAGRRVGVVNWWHTWPAEPVNGFVVADRLHYWRAAAKGDLEPTGERLTYPPELLEEIRPLVVPPGRLPLEALRPFLNVEEAELREFMRSDFGHHDLRGEMRFIISADLTCRRVLEHGLEEFADLDFVAVLFRSPDVAQHCAFEYMPGAQSVEASSEERRKFGNVVPQAYRFADEVVGSILSRLRPEDSMIVVSDHGFTYQGSRGKYGHARGEPPGVIYALGPGFRPGEAVQRASVYDVAPTALRACGFPTSREMEGRPLEELMTAEFLDEVPAPEPIDGYGPRRRRHDTAGGSRQVDREVEEHLRALGYLE